MKYKRLICICLLIAIVFNTILSPIAFAAYVFGPDQSSYTFNWDSDDNKDAGREHDKGFGAYTVEYFEIQVSQAGIYEISNLMDGGVSTNFVICASIDENNIAPLPVSAYGSNGTISQEALAYNSAANKTASVYLEPGATYYICTTGGDGRSLHKSSPSASKYITFNLNYIEPKEGEEAYTTEFSSKDYTSAATYNDSWLTTNGKRVASKVSSSSLPTVSGDDISSALENAATVAKQDKSAWYEQVVTWFIVLLCDAVRSAINVALGANNISIDSLLFNEYPNTRLAIFQSSREEGKKNGLLEESGMLDSNGENGIITKYFLLFRNIAIAVYIGMLLFMGINILLSSTGSKKEKYKERLVDWAKGVIILILFPYIMKYIIVINNAVVDYMADVRTKNSNYINVPEMSGLEVSESVALNVVNSTSVSNGDIMELVRVTASSTGRLAYAILYILLVKQLIGFIFIYFKRLLSVIFLIVIFPLVTISYAVDRIADGKSQAFSAWTKEFALNVFLQMFHVISYVLVMSVIMALGVDSAANVILIMCGFEFVGKTEELIKGLFSKVSGAKGGTVSTLNETMKTLVKVKAVKSLATNAITGTKKRFTNLASKYTDFQSSRVEHNQAKVRELEEQRREMDYARYLVSPENMAIENVSENIHIALNDSHTASPDQIKEALDRLAIAQNDPDKAGKFATEFGRLSSADQERLNKLMAANTAINETINGNKKVTGEVLTEREVNINANILVDVMTDGTFADHDYDGLKNYVLSGKEMLDESGNPILTRSGRAVTITDTVKAVTSRALQQEEKISLKNVQAMYGNTVSMPLTRTVNDTQRTTVAYHETRENLKEKVDVSMEANRLLYSLDVKVSGYDRRTGRKVTDDIARNRQEAAHLVKQLKRYTEDIRAGRMDAMSINEGYEIANTWRKLSTVSDDGVQKILAQLGNSEEIRTKYAKDHGISYDDVPESEYKIDADVGFNLEQFEAMTAANAAKDSSHIEGDEEEKQKIKDWSAKIFKQVKDGKIVEEDGTVRDYNPDKVAKAIFERAEVDDFVDYFEEHGNTKNYVRTGRTQEDMRNERFIQERRASLSRKYDKDMSLRNTSQTRARLIRSAMDLGGATVSAGATPIRLAFGAAAGALETGMAGKADDAGLVFSTNFGMKAEDFAEKPIPGTQPASAGKRAWGKRIDNAINRYADTTLATPVDEKAADLVRRQARNDGYKAKIDKISRRVRR